MTNEILILTIISIVSSVVSLLLAYFLFSLSSEKKTSNALFALFLICGALDVSGYYADLFSKIPSNIDMLRSLSCFLLLPVFYLYVVSVCYSQFKLKATHFLHALPFIISNLVMVPRYYWADVTGKTDFYNSYTEHIEVQFIHVFLYVQFIVYFVLIFRLLFHFKKVYYQNYSNAEIGTFKWLMQLTLGISFLYTIALIKNIFKFTQFMEVYTWAEIIAILGALSLNCWFVLKALKYPELFKSVNSNLELVGDFKKIKEDSLKTEEEIRSLKLFMIEKEPFLDPSLTIQNLASQMQIGSRELSVLINQHIGNHFFDFVNEYRINKTTKILQDASKNKLTILEILYEVGFNSKSSFNAAFKKHVGITPTEYRKMHS
jgi:AraC-like DNA-binding protein